MAKKATPTNVKKAERHLGMLQAACPAGAGDRARNKTAIAAAQAAVNDARRGQ